VALAEPVGIGTRGTCRAWLGEACCENPLMTSCSSPSPERHITASNWSRGSSRAISATSPCLEVSALASQIERMPLKMRVHGRVVSM
jgi:hypothetical protein